AHNEFAAGSTYSDTFAVQSADGTLTSVTINIAGTNDAAVLSAAVATLTETNLAADVSAPVWPPVTDLDSLATSVAHAAPAGTYRPLASDTPFPYTTLFRSAHNEFAAGSTYSDTFAVQSADGTLTSVTINIAGTNDAAVLSAAVATLTETNLA